MKLVLYPAQVVEPPKIIFEFNFAGMDIMITQTVVTTWAIMLFMLLIFSWGTKRLQLKPTKKQVVFEMIYSFYDWLAENVLKKWKHRFMPYVSALITFILLSNLIPFFPIPTLNILDFKEQGLKIFAIYPAFRSPSADLCTTLGLGLMTAFMFVYNGIKVHGALGYFKEFLEPSPLMLPIHLMGEIAKPFAIALRLFGNILGGTIIMMIFYMFALNVKIGGFLPLTFLVAPLHLYFDVFIGLVQSFIFTMLTMVFIATAIGNVDKEITESH